MDSLNNYSYPSKILHRFALNNSFIKKSAFDLDCLLNNNPLVLPDNYSPVYISGLARCGTTILLETLYKTGLFTSLTYRDMPFAIAPYIWEKYIAKFWKKSQPRQRAHGDKIKINYDSPEAFEEIFWMTFTDNNYIKPDMLVPHDITDNIKNKYKKYVANIISKEKNRRRYLAKNNNNLLRLKFLKRAFPKAIIIIPFRDPLEQANSLLAQHKRFLRIHSQNKFANEYMNWLGHFEFGKNFKPFSFQGRALKTNFQPTDINYWIQYWTYVYKYTLDNYNQFALFFCFEKFCEKPHQIFKRLKEKLNLSYDVDFPCVNIDASPKYPPQKVKKTLLIEANKIYNKLIEISV